MLIIMGLRFFVFFFFVIYLYMITECKGSFDLSFIVRYNVGFTWLVLLLFSLIIRLKILLHCLPSPMLVYVQT